MLSNVDVLTVPIGPAAVFDEDEALADVAVLELELLGAVDEDRGGDVNEDDECEVVEEEKLVEGNDIDVLVLATAQNCSASDSAADKSEEHCPAIQETISFVKFPRLKQ